ncbi:MAG TPA: alpha/beta hydrolase [Gemmatimonadales bacterium]
MSVNGVTLFTREIGNGPTTVVLHGGPGAHHDYLLPQYDLLATRRSLLYYDQRGGGRSPVGRDVPVDWRAHVADLHALVAARGLAPVSLLGYSWGGLLALLYTIEHTDSVTHLALVCPAPATAAARRRFEAAFAERSRARSIVEAREALQASDLRTRDPDAYRRRLFELSVTGYFHDPGKVRDLTPFRLTGRTQQAVWESLGEYDILAALGRVEVGAVVLAGRHDPIPLDAPRDLAARLGGPLWILESSGHCPHVEEPERFTELLDSWLPAS